MKPSVLFTLLLTAALPAQVAPPARPVQPVTEEADAAAAAYDDAKAVADQATRKLAAAQAAAAKADPAMADAAAQAVAEATAAKDAAANAAAEAAKEAADAEARAKQAATEAAAAKLATDQAAGDEAATPARDPKAPRGRADAAKPDTRVDAAAADLDPAVPAEPANPAVAAEPANPAVPAQPADPAVVDRPGRQPRPAADREAPRGRPGPAADSRVDAAGTDLDPAVPAEPADPEVVDRPGRQPRPASPDVRTRERDRERPRPTRVEELEPAVPLDPVELEARERQGREERRRLRLEPIDPVIVRRQFFIEPRIIEIPVLPPPPRAPEFIEVHEDVIIRREYDPQRNVVVVVEENQARELPYVAVPVLFVRGSAELLDAESRRSIEQMAGVIREVIDKDPRARFDVEGHASTDGAALFNMDLSVERARRIFDELTLRYRLPAAVLTAQGFGENYPMYPNGTEDQRMLDRRVLIVRTQ